MKNSYKKQVFVKRATGIIWLFILMCPLLALAQQPIPAFYIAGGSPCENSVQIINTSDSATNYLWQISRLGELIHETTTENPLISVDELNAATDLLVVLQAINTASGKTGLLDTIITVYPRPMKNIIIEGQTLVCSNEMETIFCLSNTGNYSYDWSGNNSTYYSLVESSIYTSCLIVNWNANTEDQVLEIVLSCEVSSEYDCTNTLKHSVLLLPTPVPQPASLQWNEDMETFLCVFDNPVQGGEQIAGNYLYLWGYYSKSNPNSEVLFDNQATEVAYYQPADSHEFDPAINTYFVEIISKEFSTCHLKVEGVTTKVAYKDLENNPLVDVLNLYPNPVNSEGFLRLDLVNNSKSQLGADIIIRNLMGSPCSKKHIELITGNTTQNIAVENLPNGNYLLEILVDGKQRVIKKFVVLNK